MNIIKKKNEINFIFHNEYFKVYIIIIMGFHQIIRTFLYCLPHIKNDVIVFSIIIKNIIDINEYES